MMIRISERYKSLVTGDNVTIEDGAVIAQNAILGDNLLIRKGAIIGPNTVIGYTEQGNNADGVNPPLTVIGENVKVRSGTVIYAGSRIGANSMLGHNCVLRERTIIGHDTYIGTLSSVEGDTTIGNYVGIQSHCYITKFCRIGDFTFIAPGFAGANDPGMTHRRAGHGHNLKGFTAEKYVRIGIGAITLPGVNLGEGSMIAAGSVVTRDVAPYTLVMGIPARVVRKAPQDKVTTSE